MRTSKLKIYIETTIPNAALNKHTAVHQKHAQQLLQKIRQGKFDAYVSDNVIQELSKSQEDRKVNALKLIEHFLVLRETKTIRELAGAYIKEGIVSAKHRNDAVHIALATYYKMDAIVSYNLDHIVRYSTKDKVEQVNLRLKYLTPKIVMPEELL